VKRLFCLKFQVSQLRINSHIHSKTWSYQKHLLYFPWHNRLLLTLNKSTISLVLLKISKLLCPNCLRFWRNFQPLKTKGLHPCTYTTANSLTAPQVRLLNVLEGQGLSLSLQSKLVMSLNLEKHFVVLENSLTVVKVFIIELLITLNIQESSLNNVIEQNNV